MTTINKNIPSEPELRQRQVLRVLRSQQDASVNFVEEQLAGFLEARYVRRCADYFVCYLSSHSGCNRGCTFCHLTATGQTSFAPSTINDYVAQALQVFKHYRGEVQRGQPPARYMHFSFMARGEARLDDHAEDAASKPRRRRTSPAGPRPWRVVRGALSVLAEYQRFSKKIVKIHHAYIEGENDSIENITAMCDAIDRAGLLCEFNLVRYNPATPVQGREVEELRLFSILEYIGARFAGRVKAVDRVGRDVAASCGMFVTTEQVP